MREQKIIELAGSAFIAGTKPDFADLLRRIETDNGASTAPQMKLSRGVAGKVIACTAAGVAAAAALGTISFVGLSMGAPKSESVAFDAECEAPAASESIYESFDHFLDSAAPMEPAAEDDSVSDSDVSDSDVSGSDEVG